MLAERRELAKLLARYERATRRERDANAWFAVGAFAGVTLAERCAGSRRREMAVAAMAYFTSWARSLEDVPTAPEVAHLVDRAWRRAQCDELRRVLLSRRREPASPRLSAPRRAARRPRRLRRAPNRPRAADPPPQNEPAPRLPTHGQGRRRIIELAKLDPHGGEPC